MSLSRVQPRLSETRQDLTRIHIESFNFLFPSPTSTKGCLGYIVDHLPVFEVDAPMDGRDNDGMRPPPIWRYWFKSISVDMPQKRSSFELDKRLFPSECRERRLTYDGNFTGILCWENENKDVEEFSLSFGQLPIMLRSNKCNLNKFTEEELIACNEDMNELGGYFITNGNEKTVRMLIAERRNQFMCIQRPSYRKRNVKYSDLGLYVRSVRRDETTVVNVIHYVEDGTCTLGFSIGSPIFLMPVVLLLRALKPTSDREIYNCIMQGTHKNLFLSERVELMLREFKENFTHCRTQKDCLSFIGDKFRRYIKHFGAYRSDAEYGQELIDNCVLIHCQQYSNTKQQTNECKFDLLCFGIRKLYAFVEGKIRAASTDVGTDCHEIVTAGHVIASVIKNGLLEYLRNVQNGCVRYFRKSKEKRQTVEYNNASVFETIINPRRIFFGCIADRISYFLNTGNLPYADRIWQQKSGWSITADRINFFRFLSHFRAVHRGRFWTEMRTTTVRKLRPEAWGFLCPVHTPDGSPCGLLNHLSEPAQVVTHYYFNEENYYAFLHVLFSMGVKPIRSISSHTVPVDYVPVVFNGIFIGYVAGVDVRMFVENLRLFKIKGKHEMPSTLSISAVFDYNLNLWPEVTLSSLPARLIRPVRHLQTNKIEWISPIEQIFMDIAVIESEIHHRTTHMELSPQSILSVLAGCTPFSDNNQSPRNMYQCQMLKQAMGLFAMNMDYRCDNKAYRLQYSQSPLVQNDLYKKYELDDYACGTNAVVAVISYTGYDMEDAMIICKQSMERGFKHGYVYVTKVIDLKVYKFDGKTLTVHFRNIRSNGERYFDGCDNCGLPIIGTILSQSSVFYVTWNDTTQSFKSVQYRKDEVCTIEQVRILEGDTNQNGIYEPVLISVKLRYDRCPIIGDKFASRAGQKGTLAQLWPAADMPFTENGIVPDLIINPHAFPSRMTIGMLLESMGSKVGSILGQYFDSSPFKFDENERAVDFFGKKLLKQGYNYYGSESMYCGTTGTPMQADIYIGIVYYQRLRHMISDKYQVRALGPVNSLTKQPLKGRKRKGGIRLGEMERDSVISHGCAYLLHDRLFECSDGEIKWMCIKCGSHLGVYLNPIKKQYWCRVCRSGENLTRVNLPHVFVYLTNELAAMNIKLTLKVEDNLKC